MKKNINNTKILFDRFLRGGRYNAATQEVEKPYKDYEDEEEDEEDGNYE